MASGPNAPGADPAVCPVDHKTREAWLEQARSQQAQQPPTTTPHVPATSVAATASAKSPSGFLSGWPSLWSSSSSSSTSPSSAPPYSTSPQHTTAPPPAAPSDGLGIDRVVSTIPRTVTSADEDKTAKTSTGSSGAPAACPVNHEVETGADPVSGNWVYPSEKMFFDAMKRKGNDNAHAADMRVVVPIHNAVNERAWKEILAWEAPYTGSGPGQCDGPRLHSFAGLSTSMSPKARLNTLLGYTAPFDRHDWVVDRCGTQIEYVIDFYAGRPGSTTTATAGARRAGNPQINFYLDVRPKLNTWQGVKMRALRGLGLQ
ncbi:Cytochrome c1 heme lyase [Sporothrix epigloea]|uniref:Holocytochrome c-type synthase n=1 Tax=Sporothrix epigloea TaxID=1892477 RepID=A0ABP0D309_9PEZI